MSAIAQSGDPDLHEVVGALRTANCDPKLVGSEWMARCPVHRGDGRSLSVTAGDTRGTVIYCHAHNCDAVAVFRALGLRAVDRVTAPARITKLIRKADRRPPAGGSVRVPLVGESAGGGRVEAVYSIRDACGELWATHVRVRLDDGGKRFSWLDSAGRVGLGGVPLGDLPLYGSELIGEDAPVDLIVITEGEKAADSLRSLGLEGVAVLGTATGASAVPGDGALEVCRDRRVLLWPDADGAGAGHMQKVAGALRGVAAAVATLDPSAHGLSGKEDAADLVDRLIDEGGDSVADDAQATGRGIDAARKEMAAHMAVYHERLAGNGEARLPAVATGTPRAIAYTLDELREVRFAPRASLLNCGQQGILREGDIAELYASRGTGKSLLAMSIALAVAAGKELLRWYAPDERRVVYVDGEMPSEAIRDRLVMLAERMGVKRCDNLVVVARDWQDGLFPRLDTPEGQQLVDPWITTETGLVIADNASTLFDPESEKDPSAWEAAQEWLLGLRRRGIAGLLIHHANRQGGARGHSRREDVMDLILKLSRPDGYVQDQGARFKVEFDKARGFYGAAAEPFVASLEAEGWTEREPANRNNRTQELRDEILSYFSAHPGESKKKAEDNVRGRAKAVRDLIDDLVIEGVLLKSDGGFRVAS